MLAQFNFKIIYRARTLNRVADALSRKSNLRKESCRELHKAMFKKISNSTLRYN
jgi:hypothetical protein